MYRVTPIDVILLVFTSKRSSQHSSIVPRMSRPKYFSHWMYSCPLEWMISVEDSNSTNDALESSCRRYLCSNLYFDAATLDSSTIYAMTPELFYTMVNHFIPIARYFNKPCFQSKGSEKCQVASLEWHSGIICLDLKSDDRFSSCLS